MKLRTKMLWLFASLIVLTTGGITVYSAVEQREQHIQRELSQQKRIIKLVTDAVSGQYFSYINQQIISVFNARTDLKEQSQILTHYIENYAQNEDDLIEFLRAQQNSYNQVDKDLLVFKGRNIMIRPHFNDVFYARSVNKQNLLSAFQGEYNHINDYYLGLFNQNSNFLSYTFILNKYPEYTICMLQKIDKLMDYYSVDNSVILSQLNELFENMQNNLSGQISIINAKDHKVLLTTNGHDENGAYNTAITDFDLELLLQKENLSQNIRLFSGQDNPYYICINYFKPLDWYITIHHDEYSIVKHAIAQAKINLLIGCVVLLLAILFTFVLANKLTTALNQIAHKADKIAKLNLDDPQEIAKVTAVTFSQNTDEIASVDHALAFMGQSVSDNLQKLIAANQQRARVLGELRAASDIQEGMLLKKEDLPLSPNFACSAFLLPAKAVGGDFYDVIRLNQDHVALVIGDVSDKGVPAALFMSTAMTLTRCALRLKYSAQDTMNFINQRLAEHNPNMMFVTMFIMILNEKTGHYTACNAGHCYPVVISSENVHELDQICGPAVGALEEATYDEYSGELQENETVVLYTDGVSEAQNEKQEFFGTERILKLCADLYGKSCDDCLNSVVAAVHDFRGDYMQTDDITVLCFMRK